MAVESFVHSLGISLTEEQKNQLHGLLKRPSACGVSDKDAAVSASETGWTGRSFTSASAKQARRNWVQGAVRYNSPHGDELGPICQVPATSKHIVWLCKWHHDKGHKPLPLPWTEGPQS